MMSGKASRGRHGQFMILAALVIAGLVIATVLYAQVSANVSKGLEHETCKEVVDSVERDFKRALVFALANATHEVENIQGYDLTLSPRIGDLGLARILGRRFLEQWRLAMISGFGGIGLDVKANFSQDVVLQPVKEGLTERRLSNLLKLFWYRPEAISAIGGSLSVDIPGMQFYGFRASHICFLNASIDLADLRDQGSDITHMLVRLNREGGGLLPDLGESNFALYNFNRSCEEWTRVGLTGVSYAGRGSYLLSFVKPHPGMRPYSKYFHLLVEDDRGIIVEATSYEGFSVYVDRHTPSNRPDDTGDEIYTLEAGINGRWFWQMNGLQTAGSFVPFPLIPIKQFRGSVTEGGWDALPRLTATQYEVWRQVSFHGKKVEIPGGLASPSYRFNASNRIVMQVGFPSLDILRQRAEVWWLDDLDADPYQGPSDLSYNPEAFEAQTTRYKVEFLGVGHTMSGDYPYDYNGVAALLMKDPVTGLTFGPWNIHGFGIYGGGSLCMWRPHGNWEIKYGYGDSPSNASVRLIAVLDSTDVGCVYDASYHSSNYYDTLAVVFITGKTRYMQMKVYVHWKATRTERGLWFASVMGNGGPTRYAYLDYSTALQGPYPYDYASRRHTEHPNPGSWASQWNSLFGRGIVINNEGLESLRSMNPGATRFSITTHAPGGNRQGSMEYEALSCRAGSSTVYAGTSYEYLWAMWMYGGNGYQEVQDYHWMFLEPYAPTLEYVSQD